MAFSKKKIIAGNWKMNGLKQTGWELTNELLEKFESPDEKLGFEMIIFPPLTILSELTAQLEGSQIKTGAQNCSDKLEGAYTGEISPIMLKDVGAEFVILGHSERRAYYGETNEMIADKANAALSQSLTPIICIGETLEQKENGVAEAVIEDQFKNSMPAGATPDNIIIAYEPVWAIGTGRVATIEDIIAIVSKIKEVSKDVLGSDDITILYGGSVKGSNAKEIFSIKDVGGALVGGASLKADDFWEIAIGSV